MTDSFNELNNELVDSIHDLSKVHREYSEKYAGTTPLGDGSVLMFTFEELHEITGRINKAEERHAIASQKMKEYKNNIIHND